MSLRESVALITGGASGIGAAIARRFADEGAYVAIADISIEQGRRLAHEIGAKAQAFALDVTNASQALDTVGDVSRRFGAVDVLVNSAGVLLNKPFIEMDPEDFARVVSVNLAGTCYVGQAAARIMTATCESPSDIPRPITGPVRPVFRRRLVPSLGALVPLRS